MSEKGIQEDYSEQEEEEVAHHEEQKNAAKTSEVFSTTDEDGVADGNAPTGSQQERHKIEENGLTSKCVHT